MLIELTEDGFFVDLLTGTKLSFVPPKNSRLKSLWNNYQNNYEYAKDIEFEDTINAVKTISEIVTPIEV